MLSQKKKAGEQRREAKWETEKHILRHFPDGRRHLSRGEASLDAPTFLIKIDAHSFFMHVRESEFW
jgi:hypothetical protein